MAFFGEFDLYSLKLVLIYPPVFNSHPSISGGSLNMGSTEITNKCKNVFIIGTNAVWYKAYIRTPKYFVKRFQCLNLLIDCYTLCINDTLPKIQTLNDTNNF